MDDIFATATQDVVATDYASFMPIQDKYESRTNVVDTIIGGGIATVGDFAASVWNSLTPESMNTTTEDLLGRIDDNALKIYQENPDVIHTASFIGGMFVPTGLALKGMSMLRAGAKGVSWFSEAGKVAQMGKINEVLQASGMATKAYKAEISALYLRAGANLIVDNAAMELALLGTMNAHPFMEDYMQDPAKNFMTSMLLGTAITGPFAFVGERYAARKLGMAVYEEATGIVRKGATPIEATADVSTKIAQHQRNVENWEGLLARPEAGPTVGINPDSLTGKMLTSYVQQAKAAQIDLLDGMAGPNLKALLEVDIKKAPEMAEVIKSVRTNLIGKMTAEPERFAGINFIDFASAKEEVGLTKSLFGKLQQDTMIEGIVPLTTEIKQGKNAGNLQSTRMVYSPRFDSFMLKDDLQNFSVAADFGMDSKQLTEGLTNNWFRIPNYDAGMEAVSLTTGKLDLEYLKKLKAVDDMSVQQLAAIAVAPDDGPMLNAILAKIEKLSREDPVAASQLKVTMTKEEPNWAKIEEKLVQAQVPLANPLTKTVGVKPTYLKDVQALTEGSALDKFSLLQDRSVPAQLKGTLQEWIKSFSAQKPIREKFLDAFTTSPGHRKYGTSEDVVAAIRKGYDSDSSKAFRAAMMQHADSEGYVYLFRGLKQKALTSNIVESFTTFAEKGAEFAKGGGGTKLYRVKVDSIYGVMKDLAVGSAGHNKSVEILVLAEGREAYEHIGQVVGSGTANLAAEMPKELLDLASHGIDLKGLKSWDKQNMKNLTANLWHEFNSTNPIEKFAGTLEEHAAQQAAYIKGGLDEYVQDVASYNLAKESNTGKQMSEAGFPELQTALYNYKGQSAVSALAQGMAAETVALRFNIPLDSVKLLQAGKSWEQVMIDTGSKMSHYTDASEIQQYISPMQRDVVVGTSATKIPVAEIRSALHKSMLDSSDSAIKDFFLQISQSAIAKDLGDFLMTTENKARREILKEGLARVTPANVGNKFFQSTDFAFRDLGEAGQVLTQMGKDAVRLYNNATDKIVKPLSPLFEAITKDPAAILEFNTARELNASLRGYREFRNGKFFVQDANEPWKQVVDPITQAVSKVRNMVEAQWKGQNFTIRTPAVLSAYEEMGRAGREMYHLNDTYRTTIGLQAVNDNGFWMPAFNPRGKYISYALDSDSGATRLLWGHTPEELETTKNAFLASLGVAERKAMQLVDKGLDQQLFNKLQGRHDEMFMSTADIGAFHSGSSAQARVPTGTAAFSEIANGYEHYMHKTIGNLLELHYSDVIGELDRISSFARQGTEGQPINFIQKALNAPVDVGKTAKNALLGRSDLNQYAGWQTAQDGIQITTELALQKVTSLMDPILNPAKGLFGRGKSASDKAFEKLHEDSIARGIPWPFEGLDDALAKEVYHVEKITQAPNLTPRVVALSNNLAATMLLKVMELGQPLVNMLSLPVLTSAASQQNFAKSFMGAQLSENFHLGTTKLMYNGVRYLGHPDYQKYRALGKELGVMTPVISEVSELLQLSRSFNPGAMQKLENAMNSKMVEMLSKPSDWAEKATREMSFANGVYLAKQAYPNLSDAGVITFARNFVDTAIGNYTAVQRPTMFQGTVGTAMGLFQTYMVTLAQQIYRKMELKDYKNLAKMMLTQSSIFGAKGLPGFNAVSEQIGEHFSDQNWDLTTGAYRALPEGAADLLLYGLPSNLGPAVYSRGDIQPRLPNLVGGLQNLASINILGQAATSAATMVGIAKQIGQDGAGMAMMEALSVQSISRPIARLSELVTGHAVTRQGNEVAGPEEIYSVPGILARVFATRGIQEAKAREAMHINSMYGTLDKEQRQEAIGILSNHIRSGTLSNDIMERVQEKYMRTGSPTGWRAAVNRAMIDTDSPGVSAVRNHLRPSAPANLMLDDMD